MTPSRFAAFVFVGLAYGARVFAQPTTMPAEDSVNAFNKTIQPFVVANCAVCHGPTIQMGDLNLIQFGSVDALSKSRDVWQSVLDQLESGEMPPRTMPARTMPAGGIPEPTEADRQSVIVAIKSEFERADDAIKPNAGRVSARRLNRVEYNNTIQDLLGVKLWPASDFPQDDAAFGFDNVADALAISPLLMEKYMIAAEKVARTAVFGPEKMPAAVKKLEQVERDVTNITVVPKEYDRTGLTTDRALHATHRFPVDGVYLFRVTARGFRPLGCDPLELGLWLDGKLVAELKVDPKEDGPSLLGGRQDLFGKPQDYQMFVTAGDHWVAASVLRIYEGLPPIYNGPNPSKRVPVNQQAEVALQQAEVALQQAEVEKSAAAAKGVAPADAANPPQSPLPPLDQAQANPAASQLARIEPNAPASGLNQAKEGQPNPRQAPTAQLETAPALPANAAPANAARGGRAGRGGRGAGGGRGNRLAPIETQVGIDYVDVIGPLEQIQKPSAESLSRLFPRENMDRDDPNTLREILTSVIQRAFRRPVKPAEIDRYVKLFDMVRMQGDSVEEALAVALQGVLVAPDFLLRIENDSPVESPSATYALTDHELATRLSYFLWSTMPDDELRAAADQGILRQPHVLETQVRRMLKDARSHALAENFAGQWLRVRALESVTPDFNLFPTFDEYLRMSMKQETETFFDFIVREDRSIMDFVNGKYSFVNEKLAKHYGIPNVTGPEFRKVDLSDTPRAGIITQASVLTVSSYATRTSPVLRGKWILENILNAPPRAPPSNVPALEATIKNNPNATLRQQLEMHRANSTCAGCHAKMDPLGMSLENFNAIGAWRTEDAKLPIDASGKLPDGRAFNGPVELQGILEADRDAFVGCLCEKLLTYAIGRGLEGYDRATLRGIVSRVSGTDVHFSNLVLEIVNSLPFQNRSAGSQP